MLLNSESIFDLENFSSSSEYQKINLTEKSNYIKNILSNQKFDYESEIFPSKNELSKLFPNCYNRFESRRKRIGYMSDTMIFIEDYDGEFIQIACNGDGYSCKSLEELDLNQNYVMIKLDKKLLKQILKGPKFAHWNNAEIGSHLKFIRSPETFERPLYHCLSYFHS